MPTPANQTFIEVRESTNLLNRDGNLPSTPIVLSQVLGQRPAACPRPRLGLVAWQRTRAGFDWLLSRNAAYGAYLVRRKIMSSPLSDEIFSRE